MIQKIRAAFVAITYSFAAFQLVGAAPIISEIVAINNNTLVQAMLT